MSVSHDEATGIYNVSEYGYEIAKSWLRTCAENNVWAMVQPSSGGFSHFKDVSLYSQFESDDKVRVYDEFFREYPNFLGGMMTSSLYRGYNEWLTGINF